MRAILKGFFATRFAGSYLILFHSILFNCTLGIAAASNSKQQFRIFQKSAPIHFSFSVFFFTSWRAAVFIVPIPRNWWLGCVAANEMNSSFIYIDDDDARIPHHFGFKRCFFTSLSLWCWFFLSFFFFESQEFEHDFPSMHFSLTIFFLFVRSSFLFFFLVSLPRSSVVESNCWRSLFLHICVNLTGTRRSRTGPSTMALRSATSSSNYL